MWISCNGDHCDLHEFCCSSNQLLLLARPGDRSELYRHAHPGSFSECPAILSVRARYPEADKHLVADSVAVAIPSTKITGEQQKWVPV
jgi:hypothetical protein